MSGNRPRISIGLPVYNGGDYLAETLDSLLAQTFSDIELIISDNASTDATEEICRTYATQDCRVRYNRNETNLGAAKNYNLAFQLSSAEYFKWAAADDLVAPEYVERCIEVLDRQPSAVVCHPKTSIIDEQAKYLGDFDDHLDFRSARPHERFRDYLFRPARMWNAIFGVMRATELAKTPLIGSYSASDQVLLGEIVLRGQVHQVPERLFFRRRHSQQSWRSYHSQSQRAVWFDPATTKLKVPRAWKHYAEYLRAIRRVPMNLDEQTWCTFHVTKWLFKSAAKPVRRGLGLWSKERSAQARIWKGEEA